MNYRISEEKRKFQIERMILFSDAVFAIAITLLVIDLKIPALPEPLSDSQLINALAALGPRVIGFLLSFLMIGLYWTVHHRLFGYIIDYTHKLLWINLFFLLGIVLLPFTTSFYSEYIHTALKTPLIVYSFNFAFIGLLSYLLHKYVSNPKRRLTHGLSKAESAYFSFRAIVIPIIFLLIILVSFINTLYALFIPPAIPLIMYIVVKIYRKRSLRLAR